MAEAIQCGKCGKRYKFKPQLAGKAIKCPACGGVIRVPEAPKPPPPAATPALADTLSFVDEELAAAAAQQDDSKLADSAPAARGLRYPFRQRYNLGGLNCPMSPLVDTCAYRRSCHDR